VRARFFGVAFFAGAFFAARFGVFVLFALVFVVVAIRAL
jgi:hypothetical protein